MKKGYILDSFIERALRDKAVVDYATLQSLLSQNGYKYINDKIKSMKQKGLLISLKRGLYLYDSPFEKKLFSKEIIANNMLGPSYISFEYALYYYGLIPEKVVEMTSATIKRSKTFKSTIGVFSYRHIDKKLYSLGVEIKTSAQGNFFIASPPKALCDMIFTSRGIQINSKKKMLEFLRDDLRIDLDELIDMDLTVIKEYGAISKSKKIEFLYKILKDMRL
jgi:predicted transcriptional regulator of viral defense system